MTVVPSGRSPAASSTSRRCSSSESVGASPVVPQMTKPSDPWRARWPMSSTNASSSTSRCSSNGVTMAVMTDPMPGTGAIIPHVVEVEARDDVRVVVAGRPVAGRRGPARRRRRAPGRAAPARARACTTGPVLAMTAVHGGVVRARRAGYFDMVATADALAGDPALHARAGALAGDDPLRRGDGRVGGHRAVGRGAGARRRRAARAPARRPPARPGPLARRALGDARARARPGRGGARPRGPRGARRGRRSRGRAHAGAGLGPRAAAPEVCVALGSTRRRRSRRRAGAEFDVVEAFDPARPPTGARRS